MRLIKKLKTEMVIQNHPKYHKFMHHSHTFMHCIYLGLVSFESHGFYGKAAIGLLAVILISLFTGIEEGI